MSAHRETVAAKAKRIFPKHFRNTKSAFATNIACIRKKEKKFLILRECYCTWAVLRDKAVKQTSRAVEIIARAALCCSSKEWLPLLLKGTVTITTKWTTIDMAKCWYEVSYLYSKVKL